MRKQEGDAKHMYTAGTGWLRERRGRKNKASGSIGFRGAGNSGPKAGFGPGEVQNRGLKEE